jgi:hypothetical protein
MADWSKGQLIDTVAWQSGPDGDSAVVRYFWLAADIAFRPRRGDSAPAIVSSSWKVEDVTSDPVSEACYIVTVSCRRFLSGQGSSKLGSRDYKSLKSEWDLGMGLSDFHLTPEMMDAAKPTEAPDDTARKDSIISISGTLYPWLAKRTNAADGSFIDGTTWGNAVPEGCPFTTLPHPKWIDRVWKCPTVTLTFYRDDTQQTLSQLGAFSGVNGTLPAAWGVPDGSVAGKWLAVDQDLKKVKDQDGDSFYEITRILMHVPVGNLSLAGAGLFWDPNKSNGTFTWPRWP